MRSGPWSMLVVTLLLGVIGGSLNVAVSLLAAPSLLSRAGELWPVLSVTVAIVTLAQVPLWTIVLLRRGGRPLDATPGVLGIGALVLAVCALAPLLPWVLWSRIELAQAWGVPDGIEPAQRLVLAGIFSGALLAAGALVYLLAERSPGPQRARRLVEWLLYAGAVIAIATCTFVWLHIYHIRGLASAPSILTNLGYLVAVGLALAIFRSPRLHGPLVAAALFLIAVAAPIVPTGDVGASIEPEPAPPRERRAGQCAILLVVDTLRADALHAYNPEAPRQRHIGALLEDSHLFLEARSPAPWTKPAMASVMTGLDPLVHRAHLFDSRVPQSLPLLAEHARAAGFRTAAVVGNPTLDARFGFAQGFDDYHAFDYWGAGQRERGDSFGGWVLDRLRPRPGNVLTAEVTDRSIDWLRRHHRSPFLLWVHYLDPHHPFDPPARYVRGTPPAGMQRAAYLETKDMRAGNEIFTHEQRQWIRSLYDAEIQYVDEQIGRLLAELRALDLYESCLIAFLSDHGEEFWEHGGFEHGHTQYDEVIHVPLAFKLPGGEALRFSQPVSTASVPATLLDLLGVEADLPAGAAPSLAGFWDPTRTPPPMAPVVASSNILYEPMEAIVRRTMKYIESSETGTQELYDLSADPHERHNRAADHPAAVAELRGLLERHDEEAARLRSALGLDRKEQARHELDSTHAERLRALGYGQ